MTSRVVLQEWVEPGAHLVANGVYRIPLPLPMDGLRAVNVYAVVGDDEVIMIDAGWALEESCSQLEAVLEVLGLGVGDITRFLVTHVHRDHYTQAVTIRREFGSRVSLGMGERASIEALSGADPREGQTQIDQLHQVRCRASDRGTAQHRMGGDQSSLRPGRRRTTG